MVYFVSVKWDFVFFFPFSLLRTHTAHCKYESTLPHVPFCNVARPRERSDRGRFCLLAKQPLHTGVRIGCHYLISISVCLCVCVTFVVFSGCESCTMPISTKLGSMEASEYRLAHGTCFPASRLEMATVAGLLWLSCVLGGADFSGFFFRFFIFLRTHTSCFKYEAALPHSPFSSHTSVV